MADTADYFRAGAFIVLFLVTGVNDLNTWLMSDLIFTFASGLLMYCNPWWSMSMQTKDVKLDVVHGHLHRLFGAFLIGPLLLWVFRRKNKDPSVIAAMLWSRIVSTTTLLIVIVVGQVTYSHIFTDKHVWFGVLGNVLWWLANVIQLLKNKPALAGCQQSRGITLLLHINVLLLTMLSLAFLSFPKVMFKIAGRKVDKYHLHLARAVGALVMGINTLSWMGPSFKDKGDVKFIFLSEALIVILCESSLLALHFASNMMTKYELCIRMSTFIPLGVVAIVGLYLCIKSDSQSTESTDSKVNNQSTENTQRIEEEEEEEEEEEDKKKK